MANNSLASIVQVPSPNNALLNGKSRVRTSSNKSVKSLCEPHLPRDVLLKMVKNGSLLSGTLRVNPKNFDDAFITHPSGDVDIYIPGLLNRNRAFNSDFVAVQVNPRAQWRVFDKYVPKKSASKPEGRKKPSYTTLSDLISMDSMQLSECLGHELATEFESDLQTKEDPKNGALRLWVNYIQRTGRIMGIIRKQHSRICIGSLKPIIINSKPSKNLSSPSSSEPNTETTTSLSVWTHALLSPIDSRIPRVKIPRAACSNAFVTQPEAYKFHRFIGQINDWPENSCYAVGTLIDHIEPKEANLVDFETTRILTGCGYAAGAKAAMQFSEEINESVQNTINDLKEQQEREMRFREDMRNQCVFSVDPETARDLDDAVHVRELLKEEVDHLKAKGLNDPMYEVGVHIADVSYFVRPNSPTDQEAARRTTSVYLVQLCVPMLPRKLCEDLCSLNAGESKFTFSVIFIVNSDAEILSHRFNRTVINSSIKLSYEDCQAFLDLPESEWSLEPSRIHGNYSISHIGHSIHILNKLAVKMRSRRNRGGSLQLNQIKSCFTLSDESRMPVGLCPFVARPANRMIEEWMLAANQTVAIHLAHRLPDEAFLRHHPSPNAKAMSETNLILRSIGYENCDLNSAASIQKFLCQLSGCPIELGWQLHENLLEMCALAVDEMQLNDKDPATNQGVGKSVMNESKMLVLLNMLTRTMNPAEYICMCGGENFDQEEDFRTHHYALNMRFYTHFTSPIRRFADVIVHRQLAKTLMEDALNENKYELAEWWASTTFKDVDISKLKSWADNCNVRRSEAREASEQSADLFYSLFVKSLGSTTELCSVVGVLDQSIDVLILSNGIRKRVYLKDLGLISYDHVPSDLVDDSKSVVASIGKLYLQWKRPEDPSGENLYQIQCGCFSTEVQLFSVFRCIVSLQESTNTDKDPLELPRLKLRLLRPTCVHCA